MRPHHRRTRKPTVPLAAFSVSLLAATSVLDGGGPPALAGILVAATVAFAILTLQAFDDEEDE